ncbi:hypothetical protein SCLCIDRAFT_778735 [Scleroderma citrinum Foug A]|uniref:Uncharacterized protein n=1 Tax=Scleroderma citrinum Foug A TaxID=1036808 RepID=A0A0C3E2Z9_9AGAM|nr:hypothetical protein SCLCIDRAFT_778735 [Scleroderma citrinum Foug A]
MGIGNGTSLIKDGAIQRETDLNVDCPANSDRVHLSHENKMAPDSMAILSRKCSGSWSRRRSCREENCIYYNGGQEVGIWQRSTQDTPRIFKRGERGCDTIFSRHLSQLPRDLPNFSRTPTPPISHH